MDTTKLAVLAAGVVLGALAACGQTPADPAAAAAAAPKNAELIDGRYLISRTDYGTWIYDRQEGGGFKPVVKEFSPLGLKTIWALQAEFKPMSLPTSKGEVIYVPYTSYSTDSGSFTVTHKFFHMTDTGLVEVPLVNAPAPPTPR